MKGLAINAVLLVLAGCAAATPESFPVIQAETDFVDACVNAWAQREAGAEPWMGDECRIKWRWAMASGSLTAAVLALSRTDGGALRALADARDAIAAMPIPDDVEISVIADGIQFLWQQPGSAGRYNVTAALRSRGVALQTLGCPQFPAASMGREKVMLATVPGREPFVLTVYSRAAPTGFEPGIYAVDADFSGAIPDINALRSGRYPGGGGRAFATEPSGWLNECPDPE